VRPPVAAGQPVEPTPYSLTPNAGLGNGAEAPSIAAARCTQPDRNWALGNFIVEEFDRARRSSEDAPPRQLGPLVRRTAKLIRDALTFVFMAGASASSRSQAQCPCHGSGPKIAI
jgi:hypothetical protein